MSEQLSLLGARNSDPRTSHEASRTAPRNSYYARIFELFTLRVGGATCDELLASWPDPKPQRSVLSKRMSELHAVGHLRAVGTRRNERNREVTVYERVQVA